MNIVERMKLRLLLEALKEHLTVEVCPKECDQCEMDFCIQSHIDDLLEFLAKLPA